MGLCDYTMRFHSSGFEYLVIKSSASVKDLPIRYICADLLASFDTLSNLLYPIAFAIVFEI